MKGRYETRCMDAVEFLASMEDESVDVVVTDSAYESLEKHRAKGTTTRLKKSDASSNEWFPTFPNARMPDLFRELYRVLRPNAHLYFMSDQETGLFTKPIACDVGFTWWKFLTWAKTGRDMDLVADDDGAELEAAKLDDAKRIGMGYHYRNTTEWVGFYEKGKLKLNDLSISDLLPRARVVKGYPTEKPVSLSRTLIEQSTKPGAVVVDPFMGSGSIGEAAMLTGRDFIGNDVLQSAVDKAAERLRAAGGVRVPHNGLLIPRTRKTLFG